MRRGARRFVLEGVMHGPQNGRWSLKDGKDCRCCSVQIHVGELVSEKYVGPGSEGALCLQGRRT